MQLYVKGPKKQGPQRQLAAEVRKLDLGHVLWTLLKGAHKPFSSIDELEAMSDLELKEFWKNIHFLNSSLWNEHRRFATKQMPFLMIHEGIRWSGGRVSVYHSNKC